MNHALAALSHLSHNITLPPRYELHPRLVYTSTELTPSSFAFLNDRTLVLPMGYHMLKFDTGKHFAYDDKKDVESGARLPVSRYLLPPLPGTLTSRVPQLPPSHPMAAVACLEYFFKRTQQVQPHICVSKNLQKLFICEDRFVSTPTDLDIKPPLSAYSKASITCFDLSGDIPQLVWQFRHTKCGRVTSLHCSTNGKIVCVAVEFEAEELTNKKNSDKPDESTDDGALHGSSSASSLNASAPSGASASIRAVSCLSVWRSDTRKLISTHYSDHAFFTARINPEDQYLIALSGVKYMRYLKCVGTQLDEVPILKRLLERTYHFQSHVWLDLEMLVALSGENECLIFQQGQLKQVLSFQMSPATDHVLSLCAYRDGWLVGTQDGNIIQVEPSKNKEGKKQSGPTKLFSICGEHPTRVGSLSGLHLSPSGDCLIGCVSGHGLVLLQLHGESDELCTDLLQPCQRICAMAVCQQRTVVVTATLDCQVQVWSHFATSARACKPAITMQFNETPLAIAIHPDGMKMLIGFGTYIGLFHILRDSIKLSYSFQLYTRTVPPLHISYDHGGDRFVVATGIHMFLYSAHDFVLLQHIQGNNGLINSVKFSVDDHTISSCNAEGGVYVWDTHSGQRVQDYMEKGIEWQTICMEWGKKWPALTHQLLHNRSNEDGSRADGVDTLSNNNGQILTSFMSAKEKELFTESQLTVAAGATFTSYRLKLIHPSQPARDIQALDFTNIPLQQELRDMDKQTRAAHLQKSAEQSSVINLDRIAITHLIRDTQRNLMFAGTSTGYILIFQWSFLFPHDAPNVAQAPLLGKFLVHGGGIQFLHLLPLSGVLLSVGTDGLMYVLDIRQYDEHLEKRWLEKEKEYEKERIKEQLQDTSASSTALVTTSANSSSSYLSTSKCWRVQQLHHYYLPKSVSTPHFAYEQHAYSGDPTLVLVENSCYEQILQEIEENSNDVKRMERTAEYQMSAQKDFYTQNLKTLKSELETLIMKREQELSDCKHLLSISEQQKSELIHEHKLNILHLNQGWREKLEKKLQEQFVNLEKKQAELDENQRRYEQEKQQMQAEHAEQLLSEQKKFHAFRLESEQKQRELETRLQEQELQYEEALSQIENENDVQVVGIERSSQQAKLKHREATAILYAEVSAAKRKLQEKSNALSALEMLCSEKDDQLSHLSSSIRRLASELSALKVQLREKEEAITRRQHELAQARQDNGTLKNFLEILEHRIAELENRETPALETMLTLKNRVESMSAELFDLNKQKLVAQNLAEQKQGESTRFSNTANALRHKLAKKEHAWELVHKELKYMVEHSGPGGNLNISLHTDLKNLFTTYFKKSADSQDEPGQDRTLIEKVENEAARQRNFLEKSLSRLRHASNSVSKRNKADSEKSLAQSINMLYEVNRLREENQRLYQRCGLYRSMVVQAGLGKRLELIDSGHDDELTELSPNHDDEKKRTQKRDASPKKLLPSQSSPNTSHIAQSSATPITPSHPSHSQTPLSSNRSSTPLLPAVASFDSPIDMSQAQEMSMRPTSASSTAALSHRNSSIKQPAMQSSQSTPAFYTNQYNSPVQTQLSTSASTASLPTDSSSATSPLPALHGKDRLRVEGEHATSPAAAAAAASSTGRSGSLHRGSTRPLYDSSLLKARAEQMAARLEQVNATVNLQQVHIQALQQAIKATHQHNKSSLSTDQNPMNNSYSDTSLNDIDERAELSLSDEEMKEQRSEYFSNNYSSPSDFTSADYFSASKTLQPRKLSPIHKKKKSLNSTSYFSSAAPASSPSSSSSPAPSTSTSSSLSLSAPSSSVPLSTRPVKATVRIPTPNQTHHPNTSTHAQPAPLQHNHLHSDQHQQWVDNMQNNIQQQLENQLNASQPHENKVD